MQAFFAVSKFKITTSAQLWLTIPIWPNLLAISPPSLVEFLETAEPVYSQRYDFTEVSREMMESVGMKYILASLYRMKPAN